MNPIKKDENTYDVEVYDWLTIHDDYICGEVRRVPDAPDDSDLRYWMFYPSSDKPLMVGDLRRIYTFMAELNTQLNK